MRHDGGDSRVSGGPKYGPAMPRALTVAGHFGELMQGRIGPDGPVALITLPCETLAVHGQAGPARGLRLHDPARLIRPGGARRLLAMLGHDRGRFALRATMPPGGGAGASTAALVALARLAAPDVPPRVLARACLAIEGASDPLMFPAPARLLWASRRGDVLEVMPPPPRFEVLGGFWGEHRRTDPADTGFAYIADLLPPWRAACAGRDLPAMARLAATSARRNLALRGPSGDPTEALAKALGAPGFAIAHTGSARALIFAPGTVPEEGPERLRRAGFRQVLRFRAGGRA